MIMKHMRLNVDTQEMATTTFRMAQLMNSKISLSGRKSMMLTSPWFLPYHQYITLTLA